MVRFHKYAERLYALLISRKSFDTVVAGWSYALPRVEQKKTKKNTVLEVCVPVCLFVQCD